MCAAEPMWTPGSTPQASALCSHPAALRNETLVGLGGMHTDSLSRAVSGQSGVACTQPCYCAVSNGARSLHLAGTAARQQSSKATTVLALGSGISFGIIPQSHRPGLSALTLTLAKL